MDSAEPPLQLRDLMAAIGFLLLQWGHLERQLGDTAPPPELDHIRSMRNLICHGLEEASADPTMASDPLLRCRDLKGQSVTVTYREIQAAIQALERFIRARPG